MAAISVWNERLTIRADQLGYTQRDKLSINTWLQCEKA